MHITQKIQIEKLIDEIDDIGEGKLTIVWDGNGHIKAFQSVPQEIKPIAIDTISRPVIITAE